MTETPLHGEAASIQPQEADLERVIGRLRGEGNYGTGCQERHDEADAIESVLERLRGLEEVAEAARTILPIAYDAKEEFSHGSPYAIEVTEKIEALARALNALPPTGEGEAS